MAVAKLAKDLRKRSRRWRATISGNLQKGNLWQRILKNTVCTAIMLSLGLIPAVIDVYGRSTYLGAMVTVFGHPGQRFGQMAEALFLIFMGTAVGLGWSTLGLYLSSLAYDSNVSAAFAIRAIFFALAIVLHGTLRSSTPRLFMFVFFYLLISLTVLTTTVTSVSSLLLSQITYPILTALAAVLFINIAVFPESSSGFLGNAVIETLHDTAQCLEDAIDWFATSNGGGNIDSKGEMQPDAKKGPELPLRMQLVSLTDRKPKLRAKFAGSKKAQGECNFEVVFAVLSPGSLKAISLTSMSRLVQNTISIVNACESKYAMLGEDEEPEDEADKKARAAGSTDDDDDSSVASSSNDSSSEDDSDSSAEERPSTSRRKSKHVRNLKLVKPVREIESGDVELFEHILSQIRGPAKVLQVQIHEAVDLIVCSLAYCYDVAKLPSGALAPHGITSEEIDLRINAFSEAVALFDKDSAEALEHAAAIAYRGSQVDVMPRMETFLISSFLITLRQAASQIHHMLEHSRYLIEKRQNRKSRRRVYFPKISWVKWLKTGGEQDINAIPDNARKEARSGRGTSQGDMDSSDKSPSISNERLFRNELEQDEEAAQPYQSRPQPQTQHTPRNRPKTKKPEQGNRLWFRGLIADIIEFLASSDDLAFALKMSIAGWLVTWPAFVPSLNAWYGSIRASWASLQLILVFEVSVGTSIQGFILRVFGVIYGCIAGFLSYEIGQGNRVVTAVILVIASIPASYTQLGTPYVKTGIISIVSMSVVGLATIVTPDTYSWEIFVKRMLCFLVGGTIAVLVELTLFPVRARDRLVESLASTITQILNMEASVAIGIESPGSVDLRSESLNARFNLAKEKADAALTAAQTFLPFTLTEPRLKGNFKGQAMIYNEIIYVLHQIIDRMDHVLHVRKAYGSTVLEELNEYVLPYRRNMASSITLTLFAVHEALTTRLPLPQFLPSSRVAHLRYVTRVREVLTDRYGSAPDSSATSVYQATDSRRPSRAPEPHVLKSVTQQKFLAWNAGSAGMMEIIEYLEELVDLAKLLVGVNAFRTGMLERPKFHEYIAKIKARELTSATVVETEQTIEKIKSNASANIRKQQGYSSGRSDSFGTTLTKRMSSAARTGADAAVDSDLEDDVVEDLPMSLQRVRTKRMEEQKAERFRRASMADPKGKGVSKGAKTWAA